MAENKRISGRNLNQRKYIELYGIFGDFDLPNKSVKVRYFSTTATGRDKKSDSYTLLKELKPMRERVKASEIKDLASLLQRNLDDFRVAFELVPYLLDSKPNISFFPAVLGVLLPADFLKEQIDVVYPKKSPTRTDSNGSLNYSFEDKWKIEQFNIGGQESPLGILSIDLKDIEIVVLDGQHRANAFRVASGAFSDKDNSVYPAFYKDVVPQENLNADLPITLIWFENQDEEAINPRYISRKLFVDVNNTAKKVSKSRKILLNDVEVPSLLTRFFYSQVAKAKSYALDEFSLLHSEFDKESDINISSNNIFSITNPEFLYEIFSWVTLGSKNYNQLNKYSSKDIFKGLTYKFSKIFPNRDTFSGNDINVDEETLNSKSVNIKDSKKIKDFEKEYGERLHPIFYSIFNDFIFFKKHFKACSEVGKWYVDGMNTYQTTVWEQVFCGGEGLYYTFKNKDIKGRTNASLRNYNNAIDEIEKQFKQFRSSQFKDLNEKEVSAAYDSANTKAFQVGLFMALDMFQENKELLDKYEEYISLLNGVSENSWVIILNEIREVLIKGVDPKQWPAYQKLILRVLQNDKYVYYTEENFLDSPDGKIFKDSIKKAFNIWWENNQDDLSESDLTINVIGHDNIVKWSKSSKDSVDSLFKKACIEPIYVNKIEKIGQEIVNDIVNFINPIY